METSVDIEAEGNLEVACWKWSEISEQNDNLKVLYTKKTFAPHVMQTNLSMNFI